MVRVINGQKETQQPLASIAGSRRTFKLQVLVAHSFITDPPEKTDIQAEQRELLIYVLLQCFLPSV
jgi:hypothetical protein